MRQEQSDTPRQPSQVPKDPRPPPQQPQDNRPPPPQPQDETESLGDNENMQQQQDEEVRDSQELEDEEVCFRVNEKVSRTLDSL